MKEPVKSGVTCAICYHDAVSRPQKFYEKMVLELHRCWWCEHERKGGPCGGGDLKQTQSR